MKHLPFPWTTFVLVGLVLLLGANGLHAANFSLTLQSPAGEPLGEGSQYWYDQSNATANTLYAFPHLQYYVRSTANHSEGWIVEFRGIADGPWKPGIYYVDLPQFTANDLSQPLLAVRPFNSTISALRGQFEIKKAVSSSTGAVSCWITFTQYVNGSDKPLTGEFKLDADSTFEPENQEPRVYVLGGDRSVNRGSPVTFKAVVQDDGLPSDSPIVKWTVNDRVFADDLFQISSPTRLQTEIVFKKEGVYTVTATVSDGVKSSPFSVVAEVHQAPDNQLLKVNFPAPDAETSPRSIAIDGQRGRFAGTFTRGVGGPTKSVVSIETPYDLSYQKWWIEFDLPGTTFPSPGTYPVHVNKAGAMGIKIFSNAGSLGTTIGGSVEVLAASLASDGTLDSFHALFTVFTGESELPVIGEVRFETPPPLAPAPYFTAGIDREFTAFESPVLRGGILSRGDSSTAPQLQWTKVSGPGDVVFTNAAALTTPVSFSQRGTYVLRLQVTDGVNVYSDEVEVVNSGRETFFATKGYNQAEFATPSEYRIEALVSGYSRLSCSFRKASEDFDQFSITFGMPNGQPLAPGVYQTGTGAINAGTMTMIQEDNMRGEFQIVGLEFDEEGAVASAWIKYRIDATAFRDELEGQIGEIRILATVPEPAVNAAPNVNVGPDLVTNEKEIYLAPIVGDDILPYGEKLQYSWQVLSGPEGAFFDSSTSRATRAQFSKNGIYRLRLTVTDGQYMATDEVQVVVKSLNRRFEGVVRYKGVPIGNAIFNLTANNSFTARVKVGGNVLTFNGRMADGAWSKEGVSSSGNQFEISFARDRNDDQIVGQIVMNGEVLDIVSKQTYGSLNRSTGADNPYTGRHTLALIPPDGANVIGAGYGDIVVKRSGAYRMNGVLADGVRFSLGGNLTIDEVFDLYLYLRGGKELVFGSAVFSTKVEEGMRGLLTWLRKSGQKEPRFPEGIQVNLALHGSLYEAPASGESLFVPAATTTARMNLFDSTLPQEFSATLNFTPGTVQVSGVATGFTVQFNPRNGYFWGTVPIPGNTGTASKRQFGGVILQGKRFGAGHFLVNKHSGGVFIEVVDPQGQ